MIIFARFCKGDGMSSWLRKGNESAIVSDRDQLGKIRGAIRVSEEGKPARKLESHGGFEQVVVLLAPHLEMSGLQWLRLDLVGITGF